MNLQTGAHYMITPLRGTFLVEITDVEDRNEYIYVTYRPITWLNGHSVKRSSLLGSFGCQRVYGTERLRADGTVIPSTKFEPAPVLVQDQPSYGCGVRAGFTKEQVKLAALI